MLVAHESGDVRQFGLAALGFQCAVAVGARLVSNLDEPGAAAMFLVAGTARRGEQYAVGMVRGRVVTSQARLFRDRPEVEAALAGVAGIALLSEGGV